MAVELISVAVALDLTVIHDGVSGSDGGFDSHT